MKPKRILIYTMNFWPEQVGIGKMCSELADYLVGMGWDVTVVTGLPHQPNWEIHEGYRGKFFTEEIRQGMTVKRSWLYVPARPTHGLMKAWRRIASDSSMPIFGLIAALTGPRPDLVISIPTPLQATAAAILLKALWRRPLLSWVQDLIPDIAVQTGMMRNGGALAWARRLEMFVHHNVDRIAVISAGFKDNLEAKGVPTSKIVHIPNWIDVRPFDHNRDRERTRKQYGIEATDFVLMHVGSVAARTGAETLLQSMLLLRDHKDIQLVFIGGGNQRLLIQDQTKKLGLERIRFLDKIENQDDLIALVCASDLMVLSQKASITDAALPSKLLTYMASRNAVVASVNPFSEAAKFVHSSGGGIVTSAEDEVAFTEAVLSLKQNDEIRTRLGLAGRRYIDENCERMLVLTRFHTELESLLDTRA